MKMEDTLAGSDLEALEHLTDAILRRSIDPEVRKREIEQLMAFINTRPLPHVSYTAYRHMFNFFFSHSWNFPLHGRFKYLKQTPRKPPKPNMTIG